MSEDHKKIWLEPLFTPSKEGETDWYDCEGRKWCQDNVWAAEDYDGAEATKYIRADLAQQEIEQLQSQLKESLEYRDALYKDFTELQAKQEGKG